MNGRLQISRAHSLTGYLTIFALLAGSLMVAASSLPIHNLPHGAAVVIQPPIEFAISGSFRERGGGTHDAARNDHCVIDGEDFPDTVGSISAVPKPQYFIHRVNEQRTRVTLLTRANYFLSISHVEPRFLKLSRLLQ